MGEEIKVMASYNRADTINSLAMAMGVKPVLDYKKNKYNTATGIKKFPRHWEEENILLDIVSFIKWQVDG